MKIYKINLATKVFVILGVFIFAGLAIFIFTVDAEARKSLFMMFWCSVAFLLGIFGMYFMYALNVIIDDEKIEYVTKLGKKIRRRAIFWNEIIEVDSGYVLYPEGGWVKLIPSKTSSKRSMDVLVGLMSLELLKDILARIPKDTKVYIYPYLKRKIEGKQTLFYKM